MRAPRGTAVCLLFALIGCVLGYSRTQFDACLKYNCQKQLSNCQQDLECADRLLDYLQCLPQQKVCTVTVYEDEFPATLSQCISTCNIYDSTNQNWVYYITCQTGCDSSRLRVYLGLVLAALVSLLL